MPRRSQDDILRNKVIVESENNIVVISQVGPQGPPGEPGADGSSGLAAHVHSQSSPALTWTINHNFGYRPGVTILSIGGVEVKADVIHTSVNQTVIQFVVATAGSARLV